MKRFSTVLAVVALVLPLMAQSRDRLPHEEERVSRVVPIAAGGTPRLKNFSGRVTIRGTERTDVAIEAVRRAPRERLDRIALDIHTAGGNVIIDANRRVADRASRDEDNNNVVQTTFEIEVPRDVVLDVDVFSSPVSVTGVRERAEINTFSGDIAMESVVSSVRAKTFSGGIRVEYDPSVSSPEVNAETFSGDIELRLSPAANGMLDFDTFSGKIEAALPVAVTSQDRRGLRGSVGSGGSNALRLKTFSGDVTIR